MIIEFAFTTIIAALLLGVPFLRRMYFASLVKGGNTEKGSKRIEYFDFLRGLAIIAVIIIHIGDLFLKNSIGSREIIYFVNDLMRFAVPFFLISSGVLLVFKNPKEFYAKKITRIFIPYALITILVGMFYSLSFFDIAHGILSGSASVPYYFLSVLLQFYILYPFLERLSKKRGFLYFSFILTVLALITKEVWAFYDIPLFIRYLFFFAYGISLKNRFLNSEVSYTKPEKYFWVGSVFVYIIIIILIVIPNVEIGGYFYNTRLFYAIALFNVFFIFKEHIEKFFAFELFSSLGKNSLWIYLIHYFVLQALFAIILKIGNAFYFQYLIFVIFGVPLSVVASLFTKKIYNSFFSLLIIKPVK
ncbi:hypothetical protein C0584_06285 [Candidatus Parcubacteria bacterium]|nr:MAG: hypothetical protein C0584_06285 [Candidatus Parcubacteria bacterium]